MTRGLFLCAKVSHFDTVSFEKKDCRVEPDNDKFAASVIPAPDCQRSQERR